MIEGLVNQTGCTDIWIDQFAAEHVVEKALENKGIEVKLTQRTKGEEDPVVAAASILAREAFLEGLKALSEKVGLHLPKGASKQVIEAGRELLKLGGEKALQETSKSHFKTLDAILGRQQEFEF